MSASNMTPSPLDDIVAELNRATQLDRDTVHGWMGTDDIEAMGALMSLLSETRNLWRIQPQLNDDDLYSFVARYYSRVLLENPDGEWSDSRTTAGWDFAKWFLQLWDDASVPRDVLLRLKRILEEVCKMGGINICNALVTAVMEHLFKKPGLRAYFADWHDDPLLGPVYNEAIHLSDVAVRRSGSPVETDEWTSSNPRE
jgi:hypothetical protein